MEDIKLFQLENKTCELTAKRKKIFWSGSNYQIGNWKKYQKLK